MSDPNAESSIRDADHWSDPGAPSSVSLQTALLVVIASLLTIVLAYELITRDVGGGPLSPPPGATVPMRAGP